jgi:hypothetical protein
VRDDDTPGTPEQIERWLAEWDAIPTPVMSDEEWATWEKRRAEDKKAEFTGCY